MYSMHQGINIIGLKIGDMLMKKRNLTVKNITINGIILSMLIFGACILNVSNAAENYGSYTPKQTVSSSVDMEQYVRQARRKIKDNWYPPTSSFENSAIVMIKLNKNGQLLDCYLTTPSEDEGFNNSLIEAVKKTQFAPLPPEIHRDSVNIDFEFSMQRRHISK